MQITATAASHALVSVADDLKAGRALQVVEAAKVAWRERLPDQRSEWFGWLVGLAQPARRTTRTPSPVQRVWTWPTGGNRPPKVSSTMSRKRRSCW